MDENKVPQLIEEVQRRPAIWNKLLNENRFKGFVGTEWDKVSANIRVSKIQAQNKWKALVKKFKSEYSRVQLHRSGDGLEDSYESNWPYYQSLSFLVSSVLPNPSTGNLDSVVDVKPSPKSLSIHESDCKGVGHEMSKKQSDIIEEILRMHSEKYASLEKSSTINERGSSSAEQDKHNMAFFETLLPTLREVSKEDILLCRNDVSRVVFNYAYKNATWKSINDDTPKEIPVASSTPVPPRRKRQLMNEDDDCQIIDSYPLRSYCQPNIKMEKKYKPTPREREMEHSNNEMMKLGYGRYPYPPHPAWKWNDNVYEQQVLPYPGQRQLRSIENQELYGQSGISRPIAACNFNSHPSTILNPESITRQIPPTHAFSAVGFDSVPRQMPTFNVNPSTAANVEYVPRQIPPSQALTQDTSSTLESSAKITESTSTMTQDAVQGNEGKQDLSSKSCGATGTD